MPGYPIRTPWDQRSVDNSPRPIAASHVLHRLLVPRHPPFALSNLTTKMLASTIQFSNNNPTTTHTHHTQNQNNHNWFHSLVKGDARQPETTTHPPKGTWLFFQDPTGCLRLGHHPRDPNPPLHTQHPPTVSSGSTRERSAATERWLASVSAIEQPAGRRSPPRRATPHHRQSGDVLVDAP